MNFRISLSLSLLFSFIQLVLVLGQDAVCEESLGTHRCRCPPGDQLQYAVIRDSIRASCFHPTTSKHRYGRVTIIILVSAIALLLLLLLGAVVLNKKLKARKANKPKEKNFKQNRGMLLQQLVDKDIAEKMLFSLEELEKATNCFDETHKIGGGGHGTVFKGVLANQQVVAIKKSKVILQSEIVDFINEVAILSTINHRNIVRLLGCCLETEVPLLVYEYISNGTLSQHLHVEGHESLSWVDRLRIAVAVANAVGYLHSSASTAIIHRDIKSDNILLDDSLTAKVSDFGASRGVPDEREGISTDVQGTIGYVDPEYCQTRRLTEKSDVYSFGAVLVELLTRKKPFLFLSWAQTGLISHFNSLVSLGKVCDILDPLVILQAGKDAEIVAALAATCLATRGDKRPSMRQMEMKLQNLLPTRSNDRQLDGDVQHDVALDMGEGRVQAPITPMVEKECSSLESAGQEKSLIISYAVAVVGESWPIEPIVTELESSSPVEGTNTAFYSVQSPPFQVSEPEETVKIPGEVDFGVGARNQAGKMLDVRGRAAAISKKRNLECLLGQNCFDGAQFNPGMQDPEMKSRQA